MESSSKWIPYLRVSTDDKGQTVEQQLSAIKNAAEARGIELVFDIDGKPFQDMKSGKLSPKERDGLRGAIKMARRIKAPIVCAKTDRLARSYTVAEKLAEDTTVSYEFLNAEKSALYDSTLRMIYFGFMSEGQRQAIRKATKDKRQEQKEACVRANEMYANGVSIEDIIVAEPTIINIIRNGKYQPGAWRNGTPKGHADTSAAIAGRKRKAKENENSIEAWGYLEEWLKHNPLNYGAAARFLNEEKKCSTPRGGDYTRQAVKNLIARFSK